MLVTPEDEFIIHNSCNSSIKHMLIANCAWNAIYKWPIRTMWQMTKLFKRRPSLMYSLWWNYCRSITACHTQGPQSEADNITLTWRRELVGNSWAKCHFNAFRLWALLLTSLNTYCIVVNYKWTRPVSLKLCTPVSCGRWLILCCHCFNWLY